MPKPRPALFKWRHFEPDILVCAVRWYLRFSLSYRDVEELLMERGMPADHTTIWRWVQRYACERAPTFSKRGLGNFRSGRCGGCVLSGRHGSMVPKHSAEELSHCAAGGFAGGKRCSQCHQRARQGDFQRG